MNIGRKFLANHRYAIRKNWLQRMPSISLNIYYDLFLHKSEKIYTKILDEYGEDIHIVVCPYAGTGDVYLACACLDKYLEKNNIHEYVLVVIGGSNVKVSQLFGVSNIIKFSQPEMDRFVHFLSFKGLDTNQVLIAHPDPPNLYTGMMDMLRNYNSLNFTDIFTDGVFGITVADLKKPSFSSHSNLCNKIIKQYRLKHKKTVLLAPYSYTLAGIPDWVWQKLVIRMKAAGFSVCTNCGSSSEREIEGSYRVCIPYSDMEVFLKFAGNFVGIRSGFCDIISSIPCKKIIIYQPYLFWGSGTNIDYFSLKNMELDPSAIEIEYAGVEFLKLIDDVIKALKDS